MRIKRCPGILSPSKEYLIHQIGTTILTSNSFNVEVYNPSVRIEYYEQLRKVSKTSVSNYICRILERNMDAVVSISQVGN